MSSLSLLLSAALLAASTGSATAAVSGRVVTPEGKPVPGATVTAYALETGNARAERLVAGQERRGLQSVKTGPDGSFRIDLADPVFAIGVRADGHAPAAATAVQGESLILTTSPAKLRRGKLVAARK